MNTVWTKKALCWIVSLGIGIGACCGTAAQAKQVHTEKKQVQETSGKKKNTAKNIAVKNTVSVNEQKNEGSASKKHQKANKAEQIEVQKKAKSVAEKPSSATKKSSGKPKAVSELKQKKQNTTQPPTAVVVSQKSKNTPSHRQSKKSRKNTAVEPAVEAPREVPKRFDIAYIWSSSLANVLDYKDELETTLNGSLARKLKIVKRGNQYGAICDINASEQKALRDAKRQNELLLRVGMASAMVIQDEGYSQLFNISYGRGKNIDSLKEKYKKVYATLGDKVGRRLIIERTAPANYALVYRFQDTQEAAYELADKHAELLKNDKMITGILPELNNEIVYGESSHLDDFEEVVAKENRLKKGDDKQPAGKVAVGQKGKSIPDLSDPDEGNREGRRKIGISMAKDNSMSRGVANLIQELTNKGELERGDRTAWAVYDLENDQSLVAINTEESFQAASMIKPFVALAYFHQVKMGKLNYTERARQMMESMIQRSNNSATNWVMKQVGGPQKCEQILRQFYGDIFHRVVICEYIPPGGKTYRNSALPSDYIRFLKALWSRELPSGKEIRRVMALPGHDRIYYGTEIPPGTLVYNKTGTTSRLCGDMGILVPPQKNGRPFPYAIVGIVQHDSTVGNYADWMRSRGDVIRQVSDLVYAEMRKIRDL